MDAIFKQACFILNTKKFVHYRPSRVDEDKVARRFEGFLTQTGKMLYGTYKDNCKTKKTKVWSIEANRTFIVLVDGDNTEADMVQEAEEEESEHEEKPPRSWQLRVSILQEGVGSNCGVFAQFV